MIGAMTQILKAKLEVLLGERGSKKDAAVRFRDLEGVYSLAIRQSVETVRPVIEDGLSPVLIDLEGIKNDIIQIDAALDAADAATAQIQADLAEATESLNDAITAVSDATDMLRSDVDDAVGALQSDLSISLPRTVASEQAVATLATRLAWLTERLHGTNSMMAQAGIYVDSATGRATISGFHALDGKIGEVSINLDAALASINLRATYADVVDLVAQAALDPAALPVFTALEGRITQAEIDINAQLGLIALKVDNTAFGPLSVRVDNAELDIDGLQAQIVLKTDSTTFDLLSSRVTEAEVVLESLDGASLLINLSDVRARSYDGENVALATIADIIAAHQARAGVLADIAYLRQEYSAKVSDDRTALASLKTELGVAINNNTALIATETTARASADSVQAGQIVQLSTTLAGVGAQATGTATALTAITTRVSTVEGQTVALSAAQTLLEADVDDNAADIVTEAAARASADGALAGLITTVTATTAANTAAISTESTARTNADSALSGRIDTVTASVGTNTASIASETAARVTADEAIAGQISALGVTLNNVGNQATGTANALNTLVTRVANTENSTTALAAQQTTLAASISAVDGSIQGYQVTLDQLSDVIVGSAVTVSLGPSGLGADNTLLITGPDVPRTIFGIPNGATVTIPAPRALIFGGQRIKIGVLAYAPATNAAARFGIGYSAGSVGNSGYLASEPLTTTPQWFTFYYTVPAPVGPSVNYLSIFGDHNKLGRGTIVSRVYVEIAAVAGDLPEISALSGEIEEIKALDLDGLDGTAMGLLLTQLQVDANGTSATITEQGTAIADLEGKASASYVLRVGAGGAEASLELVAADDPVNGPVSAFRVDADLILLDGTVLADHIYVESLEALSANLGNVIVRRANIEEGAIGSLQIGSVIQSSNFVAGETGWRIQKNGNAEFNGILIARNMLKDQGTFAMPNIGANSYGNFIQHHGSFFIETNTPAASWTGAKETFLCLISGVGTVRTDSGIAATEPQNILWGFEGKVVPLTRWGGAPSRLWLRVEVYTRNVASLEGFTLTWKLMEVN